MLDRIFDLNKIQTTINNFKDNIKKEYYNYLINEFGALFTFQSRSILYSQMKYIIDKNKQREINETINHQNAFKYIFEILEKNLDIITIIKSLHQIIGSNTIEGAGTYKIRENYLINSNGEEINFTRPTDVESKMLELRQKYENDWQELTVFERATNLHMAIINIHPFSDGNGRTARLIMNYELIKNNYPPVLINESQKLSYYAMLEEINTNTNYLDNPIGFGDTKIFNETLQQLSILSFKNMQKHFNK